MRVQWWDASAGVWREGPYLLSDAATHSHVFDKPIEAARLYDVIQATLDRVRDEQVATAAA